MYGCGLSLPGPVRRLEGHVADGTRRPAFSPASQGLWPLDATTEPRKTVMKRERTLKAIDGVVQERDCDVFLLVGIFSRQISSRFIVCCPEDAKPHSAVISDPLGGEPDAAFMVTRHLRERYENRWSLLVPGMCKSAGTILALGAGKLVMYQKGEL